jgi:hypothetical protein
MRGNQGVQVDGASGSTFNVIYNNQVARAVPLERATVPVSPGAKSPTALIRARSGVVPFAARKGLREELIRWLEAEVPFSGAVIGGAGGAGKTRLAVEICDWAEGEKWLSGILAPIEDLDSLEALAEAPIPRLIAVDYAESRAEQMKLLLPLLASRATQEAPVRVLLLVRASPTRTTDWAESLRNQSDRLDNLLDECEMHVLGKLPLEEKERAELFEAAAGAFARRNGATTPALPAALHESPAFASPLLVVLAAYLSVHGDEAPPSTREELLRAVLLHEERYWRSSSGGLFVDEDQPRQVIALATLLSADSKPEAIERLRLLPDFADAPAERLGAIARWAARQYPGTDGWSPLEPDLVGEQLVADEFSDQPAILADALTSKTPQQLIRPLEVFGRAAPNHPQLAAALKPILSSELGRLCQVAVVQARNEVDHDLLYGKAVALAVVLEKAINTIEVEDHHCLHALEVMPPVSNLVLNSLALTLSLKLIEYLRPFAEADPAAYEPSLATALSNLSVRLDYVGRRQEGLAAIEESVALRRRLVTDDRTTHEPNLAAALNNLSADLATAGRRKEGLAAIEEAVALYRRLAADDRAAYEPDLAMALNNLSADLATAGRRKEGLAAIEEAVALYRRLAADDRITHEPNLAAALNNLSGDLATAGRHPEGLVAMEEAVALYRRLAADDRAAYEPDLAMAFNNLSNRFGEAGRHPEALAAIKKCVEIRRRLVAGNPAAYEPDLAGALNNLSGRLGAAGRHPEAWAAIEECVEIRDRLVAGNPAAYEPDLAMAFNNLSNRLGEAGRHPEALPAAEKSVAMYQRLAADDPAAYAPDWAMALNNFSNRLGDAGRHPEALAAIEQSVALRRRLAADDPTAYGPVLALALNSLSRCLSAMNRQEDSQRARQEAADLAESMPN